MNPETTLAAGRVTAGLPALDPSRRFQTDRREAKQQRDRAIHEEIAQKRDDAVAPDGDRDRSDNKASVGFPLHSATIIERLTKLNPSLSIRHHPYMDRFQVFTPDPTTKERYVCAFMDKYSPQFEVLLWHEEEHVAGEGRDAHLVKVKVLDQTVRGWVTLVQILIKQKLITKAGAERLFGPIHSLAWKSHTAGY